MGVGNRGDVFRLCMGASEISSDEVHTCADTEATDRGEREETLWREQGLYRH